MVAPMIIAAGISAGSSLLSGLLGKSSAEKRDEANAYAAAYTNAQNMIATAAHNKQHRADVSRMNADLRKRAEGAAKVPIVTQGSVDWKSMMSDAESAGFNPVTWLQTMGPSYAGTTVTGSRAMEAALAGNYVPSDVLFQAGAPPPTTAPGLGEVLGNALTSGADQLVAGLNQQHQNAFQMEMLNAQLTGQARLGSLSSGRSGYVPSAFLSGSVTSGSGSGVLQPTDWETGADGIMNMLIPVWDNSQPGQPIKRWVVNPKFPDSEQAALMVLLSGGGRITDSANQGNPQNVLRPIGDFAVNATRTIGQTAEAVWRLLSAVPPQGPASPGPVYNPANSVFQ